MAGQYILAWVKYGFYCYAINEKLELLSLCFFCDWDDQEAAITDQFLKVIFCTMTFKISRRLVRGIL